MIPSGLCCHNEKNSLEETLRMMDESIAKEEQLLPRLAMKSRRNDLGPISRLPPELMCRIFSLAQAPYTLGYAPYPLKWIALTYVCRHWRNIAVNSPSLWATPPIGCRKWVEEMLRRSKACSLVIISYTDRIDSGIVPALQQIHRIRHLSLRNLSVKSWNILREIFPKSVPQLEYLYLESVWLLDSDTTLIIPENILCETGRLTQLHLTQFHLNWNSQSHFLRSLTHLTLISHPRNTSLLTGMELASALKNMPKLEALILRTFFPTQAEQQFSLGSENIHLAHLHTLSINSGFVGGEAFFSRVSFPPTAMVRLELTHDDRASPDLSSAIFALARSYANITPDTAFHSMSQRGFVENMLRLRFFTEKFNIYEIASTSAIAHLELELLCGNARPPTIKKLLNDIFNCGIPLNNIECVYLPESDRLSLAIDIETIANTFGTLPCLHSVVTAGHGTASFFKAMHLSSQARDIAGLGEIPIRALYFPYVSSIAVHKTAFMDKDMLRKLVYPSGWSIAMLRNILIQHRELGGTIETLLLRNCRGIYSKKDIKLLQKVVANVDCDKFKDEEGEEGEEGTEEDEEEEEDVEDEEGEEGTEEDEEGEEDVEGEDEYEDDE